MSILDKRHVLPQLLDGTRIAIELGCGPRKLDATAIGIDKLDLDGVDLVGDVFEILARFPAASVTRVYSAHFLEHVDELTRLLAEIARVVAPGGTVTIIVPHFSNPFYYSDPTHRTPFGLYTMAYLCEQRLFKRTIPRYGIDLPLVLRSVDLGFKSYPPRYLRHAWKRLWGMLANSSMYMREFYEENLCWIVPCYEVRFELHRE